MADMTGQVVPTPGEVKPFKVVFKHPDGSIAAEEAVDSEEEGAELIALRLKGLQQFARDEGHLD